MSHLPRAAMSFFTVALVVAAGAVAEVAPRVVDTRYPTDDIVIASTVVEPAGEDSASRIQDAIDEVAGIGGGVVFLPAGRYGLRQPIVIKEGVTLRGDWPGPGPVAGTVLMPFTGRGDPDGPPAITIERGAGLREVSVWYPDQNPGEIAPYPWTLRTSTTKGGDNFTVMNVTLVNPYQGFKTGPEGNELHTLRNVYGTSLKTGISIDTTTDIGRVIGVHFGPEWWERSGLPGAPTADESRKALRGFLLREGTGVDMGRSDWEYLYDLNITGYGTGLRVREGRQGTTNTALFGSRFLDCGTALALDKLNAIGLAATGCIFEARDCAVRAPESFTTVAQFNSCEFGGAAPSTVLLEGTGTLTFQNCRFTASERTAVAAEAGIVTLMGCAFTGTGAEVAFGKEVRCARILSCRFDGEPHITNDTAGGDVMVCSDRYLTFTRPQTVTPDYSAPHPRPATRELFDVAAFGASPKTEDNTAAFARALDAARQAGGGTVYVSAGNYRFDGSLTVPSGVELRGCFDVPHHTISGGSVLMPTAGRGNTEGTPFIQMEPGSGLRGLLIWFPEQNVLDPAPYPWAIRSLGPRCRLLDVTLGNAYQGVDFWTHPSDGHVIRYLAGAFIKRGLFVSKCDGDGWVEDVQFNPHYSMRRHASLPQPPHTEASIGNFIEYQREHLEAMVFGRCANEHLNRNFLYAAYDGLAFRDDGGATHARVVMHGTDTGSRCAVLEATDERGIEFVNAQLVPLGKHEVAALVVPECFTGKAWFFNSQMWAGKASGIVHGSGQVLIQQLNTLSGGLTVAGSAASRCTVENILVDRSLDPHICVDEGAGSVRLVGNIHPDGLLRVDNRAGRTCYMLANSVSHRPDIPDEARRFRTGWERRQPRGYSNRLAEPGGGIRSVTEAKCAPAKANAHSGRHVLRIAGLAGEGHAYAYFSVFEEPLFVYPTSCLRFWLFAVNESGRQVSVDLLFSDGSTLRDSGTRTTDGVAAHPANPKGVVGEWRQITIPLTPRHTGKTISKVMVAYDSQDGVGPFEAYVDDLEIGFARSPNLFRIVAKPPGGYYPAPLTVAVDAPKKARVRFTLDGSSPNAGSPIAGAPVTLRSPGLWDFRYAAERRKGGVGDVVFGELYEIGP